MQPHAIKTSKRSTKHVSSRRHRDRPGLRIDAQTLSHGWQLRIDSTALACADPPTRPVEESQVIKASERDRWLSWRCSILEFHQRRSFGSSLIADSGICRMHEPLHSIEYGGEIGGFGCNRDARTHWVEIDISHGGQEARLIEQRLRFEAPLPESALTSILYIGATRQVLIQATHVPADIAQSCAPKLDDSRCNLCLRFGS